MEKILSISPKLYFTPNTLGCYGLNKIEILLIISKTTSDKSVKKLYILN